ncbi:hypothetical protein RI367_004608 [Sorochytrium milnesiophthora]
MAAPLRTLKRALTVKSRKSHHENDMPAPGAAKAATVVDDDDASFWNEDDNGFSLASQRRRRRIPWRTRLAMLARYSLMLLVGWLAISIPCAVGLFIRAPDTDPPIIDLAHPSSAITLSTELIRWSIWTAVVWTLSVLCSGLLAVVKLLNHDQTRLAHSLNSYRWFMAAVVIAGLSALAFFLVFPINNGTYHTPAFRCVVSALCWSGIILVQKLVIYSASSNYYQTAHRDRDKRKVFELTTLERLETTDAMLPEMSQVSPVPPVPEIHTGSVVAVSSDDEIHEAESHHFFHWPKHSGSGSARSSWDSSNDENGQRRHGHTLHLPRSWRIKGKTKPQDAVPRQTGISPSPACSFRSQSTLFGVDNEKPEDKYSNEEAMRRAKYIFRRICKEPRITGHSRVTVDDFLPYYGGDHAAAEEAYALFDVDGNHDVSGHEMVEAVVQIYGECRDLAKSRQDLTRVVAKLDNVLWGFSALISLVCTLLVFNVNITSILVPLGSFLVALSFSFGSTARNMFESLVFIFSMHPYDVGDRVFIDGFNLVVTEIGILTTVFTRADGQRIYAPNVTLQTKLINNVRRSAQQTETIEVQVAYDTPIAKIDQLEEKLNDFLRKHNRDFRSGMVVQHFDVENVNRVRLVMFLPYKSNWQDSLKRWMRRAKFMRALHGAMQELDIKYTLPPTRQALEILPTQRDLSDMGTVSHDPFSTSAQSTYIYGSPTNAQHAMDATLAFGSSQGSRAVPAAAVLSPSQQRLPHGAVALLDGQQPLPPFPISGTNPNAQLLANATTTGFNPNPASTTAPAPPTLAATTTPAFAAAPAFPLTSNYTSTVGAGSASVLANGAAVPPPTTSATPAIAHPFGPQTGTEALSPLRQRRA